MNFADRLKQLRKEYNLTQEELAQKISKTRSTIAGYETERKEPDYETLVLLADFFNVSLDYLLGRTSNRNQILVNTQEKADDLAEKILQILIDTGELSEEEFKSGKIEPEKKEELLRRVRKSIEASQIYERQ